MPAKNCTSASIAYFISRELETSVQAVSEGLQFDKQTENKKNELLSINYACQKPIPIERMSGAPGSLAPNLTRIFECPLYSTSNLVFSRVQQKQLPLTPCSILESLCFQGLARQRL